MTDSKLIRTALLLSGTMIVVALVVRLRHDPARPAGPVTTQTIVLHPLDDAPPFVSGSVAAPPESSREPAFVSLLAARRERDKGLWQPEEDAQRHEAVVVELWDRLRTDTDPLAILETYPVNQLQIPAVSASAATLPLGVRGANFDGVPSTLDQHAWTEAVAAWRKAGWELRESEWHQPKFRRTSEGVAESTLSVVGHLESMEGRRVIVRGTLRVEWASSLDSDAKPVIRSVALVSGVRLEGASAAPAFEPMAVLSPIPPGAPTAMPIIVRDFDGDGKTDVAAVGNNLLFVNKGGGSFEEKALCDEPLLRPAAAVSADFTGDGIEDLMICQSGGRPMVYEGTARGFSVAPRDAGGDLAGMRYPMCITVGDVDADGDLDAWIGQYKPAYVGGEMPTPYFDAADGSPSYLLINDGQGHFVDATEGSGLEKKRKRRTYSASLVDLDADRDLDLLVVSDYSGIDLYLNNGTGAFTDVTDGIGADRALFGMGHCLADFNSDGKIDFFATGMSSTTARRLEALGLNPEAHPEHGVMRPRMAYGNRMYLNQGGGRFAEPAYRDSIARTGWSWGVVARDWNLDGNLDLYVANGHFSGRSCKDYCTTFWRHDIYENTASKQARQATAGLFDHLFRKTQGEGMSWNGFEHNALLMNYPKGAERNFVDLGFIADVGAQFDSRAVFAADFDGDGLEDLGVVEVVRKKSVGPTPRERIRLYRNVLEHGANRSLVVQATESGTSAVLTTNQRTVALAFVTGDSFRTQHALVQRISLQANEVPETLRYWNPRSGGTLKDLSDKKTVILSSAFNER